MQRRYRRRSGSFRRGILGGLAAVRVDGSYKALRLLVWRGVDTPQEILERKGLRPDDDRLVSRVQKILYLVVHFAAPEVSIALASSVARPATGKSHLRTDRGC